MTKVRSQHEIVPRLPLAFLVVNVSLNGKESESAFTMNDTICTVKFRIHFRSATIETEGCRYFVRTSVLSELLVEKELDRLNWTGSPGWPFPKSWTSYPPISRTAASRSSNWFPSDYSRLDRLSFSLSFEIVMPTPHKGTADAEETDKNREKKKRRKRRRKKKT